jgi:MSHA biogenesis protein MshE
MNEVLAEKKVDFLQFLYQVERISLGTLDTVRGEGLSEADSIKKIVEMGRIDDAEAKRLQTLFEHHEQANLSHFDDKLKDLVSENIAKQYILLPIKRENEKLYVAFSNPLDSDALTAVTQATREHIVPLLAKRDELKMLITSTYRHYREIVNLADHINVIALDQLSAQLKDYEIVTNVSESIISSLLDTILDDAIEQNASDIHIESSRYALKLRYRISGTLIEQAEMPMEIADYVLRRLLVISEGDITQMLLPQDTSFEHAYRGSQHSLRMSTLFTSSGYSIVLRILMEPSFYTSLKNFVVEDEAYAEITQYLTAKNGMMLLTGPTSSGKTTTLYASLNYVNDSETKIITMEDPVESELKGLNQVEVAPDAGLDFADVIRSTLRQNPDVLMVGEIRDATSAVMAMRAAITGIMVMSTLHTKTCSATVLRLLDLGVDPGMISIGLKLTIAQRLVRCICPYCKEEHKPSENEISALKVIKPEVLEKTFYRGKGCEMCVNTGFGEVRAVFEVLRMDTGLSRLIADGNVGEFAKAVREKLEGKTLLDKAFDMALKGVTTIDEVIKLYF